ncbi:GNAT family N-acetyltransferase, partial [Nonomuraea sp. NPDC048901]|uniref:GNAT family N-acetyltransferase n=1 Tax=Nonomuraea sp. NPDC048901 TaxID=3155627 RepID=UPI0034013BFF
RTSHDRQAASLIRPAEDRCGIEPSPRFRGIDTGVLEPEIGYEIKHPDRGSGFALEAAQAVVSELQATTTVKRLWATVRPCNAASLRICKRLGLVPDRVETDKRGELLYLVRDLA